MIILDFETNGLTMNDIEITQMAYLRVDEYMNIEEKVNRYYTVDNIKDSDQITGLTKQKLVNLSKGKRFDMKELARVQTELKHEIIIGQNISYDLMVLDAISLRMGSWIIPKYPMDIINLFSPTGTLATLDWIVKNNITGEGMELLEREFAGETYHDAMYDVYSVYAVIRDNKKFKRNLHNYLKTVPKVV